MKAQIADNMEPRIHDDENGLDYVLAGDYYIPVLTVSEEYRSIGRWGRMHRDYLREEHPALLSDLTLSGKLWTYLADLNEQAEGRLLLITAQMQEAEGVDEDLKRCDQMEWIRQMNSIRSRAEEIVLHELILT